MTKLKLEANAHRVYFIIHECPIMEYKNQLIYFRSMLCVFSCWLDKKKKCNDVDK